MDAIYSYVEFDFKKFTPVSHGTLEMGTDLDISTAGCCSIKDFNVETFFFSHGNLIFINFLGKFIYCVADTAFNLESEQNLPLEAQLCYTICLVLMKLS